MSGINYFGEEPATARTLSLSPAFCARNGAIELASAGDTTTVGLLEPGNAELRERISRAWPHRRIEFTGMDRDEFALALNRLCALGDGGRPAGDGGFAEGRGAWGEGGIDAGPGNADFDRAEAGAPIVSLLNSIFLEAVALGASDVHLEPGRDGTAVRFRVDGSLRQAARVPASRGAALAARIKHLADLDIVERRRPQDGSFTISASAHPVDVRVSTVPTAWGESVVARLLDRDGEPPALAELGFSPRELERLYAAIRSRSGLVLVTGPTGSGKTTTLAALLREARDGRVKIVSIEDPVEYRLEGVTQIQTDDALGLSFESILRRVFRQDPDVIMVGEIRDAETARLAARAALTGHLVLATAHAGSALEAVPRLINLGVEPFLVAAVLRLVLAQRLLRKPCVSCRGSGCPSCGDTGYSGRFAVAESLVPGLETRQMIERGYSASELERLAGGDGYVPLREDAAERVARGETDAAEALREVGP